MSNNDLLGTVVEILAEMRLLRKNIESMWGITKNDTLGHYDDFEISSPSLGFFVFMMISPIDKIKKMIYLAEKQLFNFKPFDFINTRDNSIKKTDFYDDCFLFPEDNLLFKIEEYMKKFEVVVAPFKFIYNREIVKVLIGTVDKGINYNKYDGYYNYLQLMEFKPK